MNNYNFHNDTRNQGTRGCHEEDPIQEYNDNIENQEDDTLTPFHKNKTKSFTTDLKIGDKIIVKYVIPYNPTELYRLDTIVEITESMICTKHHKPPLGISLDLIEYNDNNLRLVESTDDYFTLLGLFSANKNIKPEHMLINGLKDEDCLKDAINAMNVLQNLKNNKRKVEKQHDLKIRKLIWDATGGQKCNFPNPYLEGNVDSIEAQEETEPEKMITAKEFQESKQSDDNEYDLLEILKIYPNFTGQIIFDNENYDCKVLSDTNKPDSSQYKKPDVAAHMAWLKAKLTNDLRECIHVMLDDVLGQIEFNCYIENNTLHFHITDSWLTMDITRFHEFKKAVYNIVKSKMKRCYNLDFSTDFDKEKALL